jgi:post-segregation antitoxin (ccd killing protein)
MVFIIMGRKLKTEEEKKTKVSVALDRELLTYYRNLHINLSSLVNKLLNDYKKNGNENML